MANLPNDHRVVVHQHFVEGLHVAKRSDRAWAGLSTDLMIEHVLNAQHENKWSSDQRQRNDRTSCLTLLLAMPACAEVNRAM